MTPPLLGSLLTVAVNWAVELPCTVIESGETDTVIAGTVIVAELVFVESSTEVAVSVTVKLFVGAVGGAV